MELFGNVDVRSEILAELVPVSSSSAVWGFVSSAMLRDFIIVSHSVPLVDGPTPYRYT